MGKKFDIIIMLHPCLIACLQEALEPLGTEDVLNKTSVLGSMPIFIGGSTGLSKHIWTESNER